MDLWKNYKQVISDVFPDLVHEQDWCNWKGDLDLDARLYKGKYFIKGYYGKTVKSASVLQEIEFILRTEKLIKFFDSGILITEKNVYSIGEYHEKINGEQKYKSFSFSRNQESFQKAT